MQNETPTSLDIPTTYTINSDPYRTNIPVYLAQVYDWAYVDPRNAKWLDRNLVVWVLLFLQAGRLMNSYLNKVEPGMKVWQVAHVYGNLVERVAQKVGTEGVFHLTDVAPVQIEHAVQKLLPYPWAEVIRADATQFEPQTDYDLLCSFFLLHEIPDEQKRLLVNNMLSHLHAGNKAIFVDYGRPARWQPIRYILKFVNDRLEPFAESLWRHEIHEFAAQPEDFIWKKRSLFGGVYQFVEVTRKA